MSRASKRFWCRNPGRIEERTFPRRILPSGTNRRRPGRQFPSVYALPCTYTIVTLLARKQIDQVVLERAIMLHQPEAELFNCLVHYTLEMDGREYISRRRSNSLVEDSCCRSNGCRCDEERAWQRQSNCCSKQVSETHNESYQCVIIHNLHQLSNIYGN